LHDKKTTLAIVKIAVANKFLQLIPTPIRIIQYTSVIVKIKEIKTGMLISFENKLLDSLTTGPLEVLFLRALAIFNSNPRINNFPFTKKLFIISFVLT
jgi:hypothetical protein